MSQYLKPALSTVEIPLYDIGRKSAEVILNQITNAEDFKAQQYFVQCGIIERESIGKI
jgi:LacI family transcriptional regulator